MKRINQFTRKTWKYPMKLQIFAGGETEEPGAGGKTKPEGNNEPAGETPKKTFDEMLSDSAYQTEFDKRIQKALEEQQSKLDVIYNDKATEAEKLAKMNEKEKAEYLQKKQERELTDREAAITRRELMAEAKNTLIEKSLPVELAEVLNYSDADTCGKSIDAIEKAFKKAVESAVEDRLKGGKPPIKAPQQAESELAKQVEQLMLGL